MPFTRTYNWGESLRLEAAMADGGLKAATDRIASTMGRAYGSRNTFAALFDLDEPAGPGGGRRPPVPDLRAVRCDRAAAGR